MQAVSAGPAAARSLGRYKVLAAGVFGLTLTLGPARFAYTPLFPLMQQQANLGIAAAAWLASINYAGYLSGALAVAALRDPGLSDRLYRTGLILAVLTTLMMGTTTNFALWAISRYLAGLCGAAGSLLGSGLILNWLIRHNHRSELGIQFAGVGLAIVISAGAVMAMSHYDLDWQDQWYAFSALGAALLVPALAWLPSPLGGATARASTSMPDTPPSPAFIRLLWISYFCAGIGYVVSATFIVAIVDHVSRLSGYGTSAFLVIGLTAAPSCALWDFIARRVGNLNALLLASVGQAVGILFPALTTGLAGTLCGAALFGATVMGVVSLVLTMAGRYYPSHPARMMGKLTVAYSLAQVIGPAITGTLAEQLGSYRSGLYIAAAVMMVGIAVLGVARFSVAHD